MNLDSTNGAYCGGGFDWGELSERKEAFGNVVLCALQGVLAHSTGKQRETGWRLKDDPPD